MKKYFYSIVLSSIILCVNLLAQTTVQAGISTSGTSLIISAKPNGSLSGNCSGGNITIVWPTSYNITLGAVTTSIGAWALNVNGTSGVNSYANYAVTSGSTPFTWANASVNELFRVVVNQTGSGTGTFSVQNGVPDATGNWYFEATNGNPSATNGDYTNYLTPFYQSTVSNVPLPVELTSFTSSVKESHITLSWQTKTEVNNYGFEIQRSAITAHESQMPKADNWTKISFVSGHGNSNSVKDYTYSDENVPGGKYSYRLKQIDNDGAFKYSDEIEVEINIPLKFGLEQNYPNPFNPTTAISYQLAADSHVLLKVYDVLGREVMTLVNENMKAGSHTINFDASRLSNGVYIYKITAGNNSDVKKMLLLK